MKNVSIIEIFYFIINEKKILTPYWQVCPDFVDPEKMAGHMLRKHNQYNKAGIIRIRKFSL